MEKKSASNSSIKKEKRLFRKLSGREKTLIIVFLAALLVGLWLPERIIVATSPSLNHRVFFRTHAYAKKIKTGDYLLIKHADTSFVDKGLNKNSNYMIKQVGCSPGESLTRNSDGQFYCDEKPLGKALDTDGTGRLLPQFTFVGPVPDGSFFMVGSNPRSFDSKYFGFVHEDNILYKALPVW